VEAPAEDSSLQALAPRPSHLSLHARLISRERADEMPAFASSLPSLPRSARPDPPRRSACMTAKAHMLPAISRRAALAVVATAVAAQVVPALPARAVEAGAPTAEAVAGVPAAEPLPARSPEDAKVTQKVYLDIKVAGKPQSRVVIGLFGEDAPVSVASFLKVCQGTLRGRGGRTVSYAYSQAWRIVKDVRVDLGRVKQIDELNQSPGTPQRQIALIEVPENRDVNDIAHSVAGAVSVRRGGGAFEFSINPQPAEVGSELDLEDIVIGLVLEGMDTIEAINRVPTNQKTPRDGFRKVGKVIGDGRAKLDVCDALIDAV
jgi:peptidylprolyl isomerase